ncbi:MAG: hypothetical protein KIT31_05935 [Deltaproteobacteria bacterium]|nr:hypothetical protein [Deltaproteobacteria bacterium]
MMRALLLLLLCLAGCKTDKPEAKKKELEVVGSGSAAKTTVSLEDAQPELEGGVLQQIRAQTDAQLISIWCLADATGRDAVVKVADSLRRDGWDDVSTRGAAERFAIGARKADLRYSATVGGRDQACSGTLVIATIVRLGAGIPAVALPPGNEALR